MKPISPLTHAQMLKPVSLQTGREGVSAPERLALGLENLSIRSHALHPRGPAALPSHHRKASPPRFEQRRSADGTHPENPPAQACGANASTT
jgi:hypothetical protein